MTVRVLAVLVSAVLWTRAFPPHDWWPLAWIGIAPFLVAVRAAPGALRAAGLAWLWCTAFAWCVGAWLPRGVMQYFGQPAAVGGAFFLGTATLTAGLHYMGFALVYRALARRWTAALPLLAAAAFVAAEAARVRGPGGDPWGLVGYSQLGCTALLQIAAITGVYGASFVVVAVNAAIAELWLARRTRRVTAPALRGAGAVAALALAVLLAGALRLRQSAGAGVAPGPGSIAVVQGDVDVGAQWSPADYGRNLAQYLRLTSGALDTAPASLVIWPESAMTFFLDEEPAYRRTLAGVLGPHGAQLLAGAPRAADARHATFANSAFLLAPDGTITARYDKERLLPFAEYFPLSLDLLRRRFGRVRQFSPGDATAPLDTAAGRAGVLICNEGFYGDLASARVRAGATLLVSLANDTWVSDAQFARMALDMTRVRAVEQRRWLVRASTWGPSALVDPFGRMTAVTAPDTAAVVAGAVEPLGGVTPYARLGDAFAIACTLVAMAALAARRRA